LSIGSIAAINISFPYFRILFFNFYFPSSKGFATEGQPSTFSRLANPNGIASFSPATVLGRQLDFIGF
jgi:hypothetical protein